ncbi:MAG: flagellar basal body P-ring formation chaperone FlgA [Proteobacteria bacterium]|nr:flagellar basal body P-ring formation chaperone FlgA [Pseudomonadota bacterium]
MRMSHVNAYHPWRWIARIHAAMTGWVSSADSLLSSSDLIGGSTITGKQPFKYFAFLVLLSTHLCYGSSTLILNLKPHVTIAKPDIYLGDVVSAKEDDLRVCMMQNPWLAHAPKYNQSLALSQELIAKKLHQQRANICKINWQGNNQVNVWRSGQNLDIKTIETQAQTKLKDALQQRYPHANISLSLNRPLQPVAVAPGKISVRYELKGNIAHRIPVNVAIYVDEQAALNITLWFNANIQLKSYQLQQAIGRHTPITVQMLKPIVIDLAQSPDCVIDSNYLQNRWSRLALPIDHILQTKDLEVIDQVSTGQIIDVTTHSDKITLQFKARALNDAACHHLVLVENLNTHERYYVTVTGNAKATTDTALSTYKETSC